MKTLKSIVVILSVIFFCRMTVDAVYQQLKYNELSKRTYTIENEVDMDRIDSILDADLKSMELKLKK